MKSRKSFCPLLFFVIVLFSSFCFLQVESKNVNLDSTKTKSKTGTGTQLQPAQKTQVKPVLIDEGDTAEEDEQSESSCSNEAHLIMDWNNSCCNRTIVLKHGIDQSKYWKECAVPFTGVKGQSTKKNKGSINDETYVNSTRRVYSCILSNYLKKKNSISLTSFASVMTVNYPANIKSAIMNYISKSGQSGKNEVSINDYEKVRKLRTDYFSVQKDVCASFNPTTEQKSSGNKKITMKNDKNQNQGNSEICIHYEEVERDGGSCCGNDSVPLDIDYWHAPPSSSKASQSCSKTLAEEFKKWKIEDSQMDSVLEICKESCKLKQEGVILAKDWDIRNVTKKTDLFFLIKKIAPPFLSKSVLELILNYTLPNHNNNNGKQSSDKEDLLVTTKIESDMMKKYLLTANVLTSLRPCVIFRRLTEIIYDALYLHCFPHSYDPEGGPQVNSRVIVSQGRNNNNHHNNNLLAINRPSINLDLF